MQNPFTHAFGARPVKYISTLLTEEIIENFSYPVPSERCYMLTGVRGCGKTVMMSVIAKKLSERKDWVVYTLNAADDMVSQLAAKLSSHPLCAAKLVKPKEVRISVLSVNVGIEYDSEKIFDIYTMIGRMAETLAYHGIKIMLTVDDVMANDAMKVFAHAFQQLITDPRDLPVYLIMTGLYSNYREIRDSKEFKGSTFLTRMLERDVKPLDESQMAVSYFNTFPIDEAESIRLAKLTRGFAFAYQVLGYWYFEKNVKKREDIKDIEIEYRSELIKYCYARLWAELSEKDRMIVKAMTVLRADERSVRRSEIIAFLEKNGQEVKSSTFGTYRDRLTGKGIIAVSENRDGLYWFPLPQFGNYIRLYNLEN